MPPIEVGLTTQGFRQMRDMLSEIPRGDRRSAIAAALTASGLAVQENVRADAPVSQPTPHKPAPGGYRRGIKVTRVKETRRESSIMVRATARHSHFVEYGTKVRRPKRAKVMTANPGTTGPFYGIQAKALPGRLVFTHAVARTNIDAVFVRGLNRQLEAGTRQRLLEDRSIGR